MAPQRYNDLLTLIEKYKPKTICEVGTWRGDRAMILAEEALKYSDTVHYYGFDLFEFASDETDKAEMNIKRHYGVFTVNQKLLQFASSNKGFTFKLYKGNTNETMFDLAVDLAFIDGGHSIDTIQNDYDYLKGSKVIVFDDYYMDKDAVDLSKWGCNSLVESLDNMTLMPSVDVFPATGHICLVTIDNSL